MIRVTIELLPHGSETNKKEIGKIYIANDATSYIPTIGNYVFKIMERGRKKIWKQGEIIKFPRKRLNAYDLLYRVLEQSVGERNKK